jgi:hypothetical protein
MSKVRRYMAASWTAIGHKPATLVGVLPMLGGREMRQEKDYQVPHPGQYLTSYRPIAVHLRTKNGDFVTGNRSTETLGRRGSGASRKLAQLSLNNECAGVNSGSRHHNLQ